MKKRTCLDCGVSIVDRHHSAKWCKPCGDRHEIERKKAWISGHSKEIYDRRSERMGREKMGSKIEGPYRVRHLEKDLWEVVELENDTFQSLRPRKVYEYRQSAYGMCKRLNLKMNKYSR